MITEQVQNIEDSTPTLPPFDTTNISKIATLPPSTKGGENDQSRKPLARGIPYNHNNTRPETQLVVPDTAEEADTKIKFMKARRQASIFRIHDHISIFPVAQYSEDVVNSYLQPRTPLNNYFTISMDSIKSLLTRYEEG
ncbi:hypothetical protein JTB14_027269 [Gonioctena quinquepunctata]|nr:hypothetical protein JTB14_027269 [Gonioctena quinquepunctata]